MIHVSMNFRVTGGPDDAPLDEQADLVMDELLKLEECNPLYRDSGAAVDLDEQVVTLEIAVDTDDMAHALKQAISAFRTAVHAIGGATPDWPTGDDIDGSLAPVYRQQRVLMEPVPSLS